MLSNYPTVQAQQHDRESKPASGVSDERRRWAAAAARSRPAAPCTTSACDAGLRGGAGRGGGAAQAGAWACSTALGRVWGLGVRVGFARQPST